MLRAIRISTAMRFFNDCACFEDKMSNISGLFLVKPKIKKIRKKKHSTVSKLNITEKDIDLPHFQNIATNFNFLIHAINSSQFA